MEDTLLKKLKAGIEEEIQHYESMLKVSREEQEVLKKEGYSRELITLASEKLRLMNQINQISLVLSPLKVMWIKERETESGPPSRDEIDPLVNQLSKVLEDLLAVDRDNTRKLAQLTGTLSVEMPSQNADPAEAAKAYKTTSAK